MLLDGDKIAALVSILLHQELRASGLLEESAQHKAFTCAVVQTAYANGASTQFIRALGMPIHMAKTGVKYLHHKAQEFDVGIYFEANGHGTVVFSDRFVQAVQDYVPQGTKESERKDVAFARLRVSKSVFVFVHASVTLVTMSPLCQFACKTVSILLRTLVFYFRPQ